MSNRALGISLAIMTVTLGFFAVVMLVYTPQ